MLERNMNSNPNPMIPTEAGVRAVKRFVPLAKKNNIDFALVGGIAMHFYGSPRLTKDVDVTASDLLPIDSERKLGFGGARYRVNIGKLPVPVDWMLDPTMLKNFTQKPSKRHIYCQTACPLSLPNGL